MGLTLVYDPELNSSPLNYNRYENTRIENTQKSVVTK